MKPNKKQIDESLKYSVIEGSANSVKNGIVDNYIIPFAMLLGAGNQMIGLISSLPPTIGYITQIFSTKIIRFFKSKKNSCRLFKFLSSLFWIPIMLIPFIFTNGIWWLLLFLTIRMMLLLIDSTIWSSWISDIVPRNIRGSFFGKRNIFGNITSFIASLIAGWILGIIDNVYGFIIIFSIAFIFSLISNFYLGKIVEIPIRKKHKKLFNFKHFIDGINQHSNYSNFVLFKTLMNFAIYIVAPFWIVFVLRDLNIGYFWYAISIAVYMIVNTLSQKYWGHLSDRFGDKKIMFVCALLLPFTGLIMVFVTNLWQLMIERIFSAFVFSGFFLTSFNYLLDVSPQEDNSTFIANHNLFAGLGAAVAPLIGGILIGPLSTITLLGLGGIQSLFFLAFILRFVVAGTMMGRLHSIRVKKNIAFRNIFLKATFTYPLESIKHEFNYVARNIHRWENKFRPTTKK